VELLGELAPVVGAALIVFVLIVVPTYLFAGEEEEGCGVRCLFVLVVVVVALLVGWLWSWWAALFGLAAAMWLKVAIIGPSS